MRPPAPPYGEDVDAQPGTLAESALAVVRAAAALVAGTERAALAGEPDGVHQHRVAVRRLRSVLAGFAGAIDPSRGRIVRVEHGRWGAQLGVVRDLEVLADAAAARLDALDVADERMRARLVDAPRAAGALGQARLVAIAASPAGAGRRERLHRLAEDPGLRVGDVAAAPALTGILRHEARRVRRAWRRVLRDQERHADGPRVHELRKAGRRLRYVAEAIGAAAPDLAAAEVAALAEAGDLLHSTLGDRRDAAVLIRHVRREQVRARRAGEATEGYERMLAELTGPADAEDRVAAAVRGIRDAARALP